VSYGLIGCAPQKNLHSENSMIVIDSIRIKKGLRKQQIWDVISSCQLVNSHAGNVSNDGSMDV